MMRRIVVDLRMPNWIKYGVVVYAATDTDRDAMLAAQYPDAIWTITSDRPATPRELRRAAAYDAWLARWTEAARHARAGRHMSDPPR